jgi:hypothetical protein
MEALQESLEKEKPRVREIVAIFVGSESLLAAIDELAAAGYSKNSVDLLASDKAVQENLGDIYVKVHKREGLDDGPPVAYVAKESLGESFRSIAGAMGWVSAGLSGGVLLVSVGVIGSPLLAALAAAPAVGGVAAILGGKIRQTDAEYLEEQIDQGHLLLFVRADTPAQEEQVSLILTKHTKQNLKIVDVPVEATYP